MPCPKTFPDRYRFIFLRRLLDLSKVRVRQTGVALILVLWLVALLSLMAASFGLGIRREASLATIQVQQARLLAACEAGVNYAAFMVRHPDTALQWAADGTLLHWQWMGVQLRLRVVNETGKVDINQASPALLQAVLRLAGADDAEVEILTDSILDWRDGDRLRRLHGAELPDYVAAGLAYGPSDRPFQSLDELAMVLGMKPSLFARVLPWVTIFNRRNGINPAVAPVELLRSLPGMDPQQVDLFVRARQQLQKAGQDAVSLSQPENIPFLGNTGDIYSIFVQANAHGRKLALYAVVNVVAERLDYLLWRSGVPTSLFTETTEEAANGPGAEAKSVRKAASPAAMTR